MGFHNPTRQRGIFANTAETQERNPSLTRRVVIRSRAGYVGQCWLWKLEIGVHRFLGNHENQGFTCRQKWCPANNGACEFSEGDSGAPRGRLICPPWAMFCCGRFIVVCFV